MEMLRLHHHHHPITHLAIILVAEPSDIPSSDEPIQSNLPRLSLPLFQALSTTWHYPGNFKLSRGSLLYLQALPSPLIFQAL
jgi:hypothetical protein